MWASGCTPLRTCTSDTHTKSPIPATRRLRRPARPTPNGSPPPESRRSTGCPTPPGLIDPKITQKPKKTIQLQTYSKRKNNQPLNRTLVPNALTNSAPPRTAARLILRIGLRADLLQVLSVLRLVFIVLVDVVGEEGFLGLQIDRHEVAPVPVRGVENRFDGVLGGRTDRARWQPGVNSGVERALFKLILGDLRVLLPEGVN